MGVIPFLIISALAIYGWWQLMNRIGEWVFNRLIRSRGQEP